MSNHEDFRYVPESEVVQTSAGPLPVTPEAKALRKPNEIARRAASLCWKITSKYQNPADWKAELEASPPELRECLRQYLVQKFNALKDRKRREAGKRSETGDRELAKIGEIARRL